MKKIFKYRGAKALDLQLEQNLNVDYISEKDRDINNLLYHFANSHQLDSILWYKIHTLNVEYEIFEKKVKAIWPDNYPLSLNKFLHNKGFANLKEISPHLREGLYLSMIESLKKYEKSYDKSKDTRVEK